jgi:SanA protein
MLKRIHKMVLRIISGFIVCSAFALILPRLFTMFYARSHIYQIANVPPGQTAIVFGAGLWRDGSPTPVLRDRVTAAASLYFSGKVEKLLMSGTRFESYNEPDAMRSFALELGVPDEAIVLDYDGWRTYDTCYRAREIYGLREAVLVTQTFHLPRALYVCDRLGMSVVGVSADLRVYRQISRLYWNLRELPATLTALWEVNISHPKPALGSPQPIFPTHAQ